MKYNIIFNPKLILFIQTEKSRNKKKITRIKKLSVIKTKFDLQVKISEIKKTKIIYIYI